MSRLKAGARVHRSPPSSSASASKMSVSRAIVFTDIDRDGILKGINFEKTLELANSVNIPVIASGGLASIKDVERLLEPDCAILEGAISGRAIYDGRLDPKAALKLIREAA